jgi:hypothetical protein
MLESANTGNNLYMEGIVADHLHVGPLFGGGKRRRTGDLEVRDSRMLVNECRRIVDLVVNNDIEIFLR